MSGLSKPVRISDYRKLHKAISKLPSKDVSMIGKLYYDKYDGNYSDFGYLFFKVVENVAIINDSPIVRDQNKR